MNQMSYATAKQLLDRGVATIDKIQAEVFGFYWLAEITVDGKHKYLLKLSAAQTSVLKKKGVIK